MILIPCGNIKLNMRHKRFELFGLSGHLKEYNELFLLVGKKEGTLNMRTRRYSNPSDYLLFLLSSANTTRIMTCMMYVSSFQSHIRAFQWPLEGEGTVLYPRPVVPTQYCTAPVIQYASKIERCDFSLLKLVIIIIILQYVPMYSTYPQRNIL